jgi:uncharacterized repeat protein (TIGR01451 family)
MLPGFLLLCSHAAAVPGTTCCRVCSAAILTVCCAPRLLLLLLLLPRLQPGAPFTVDKTGPSSLVKPGDAFSYTIAVKFTGATTGVTITDDLPVGLVPGSTAATWTAASTVAGNPATGGKAGDELFRCTCCNVRDMHCSTVYGLLCSVVKLMTCLTPCLYDGNTCRSKRIW